MQQKGVDLQDPDWKIDDGSIPFCSDHLPVRKLLNYYGPELAEHLAQACLADGKARASFPSPKIAVSLTEGKA